MMKGFLVSLLALGAMTSFAMADTAAKPADKAAAVAKKPVKLTEAQMDKVTAGDKVSFFACRNCFRISGSRF